MTIYAAPELGSLAWGRVASPRLYLGRRPRPRPIGLPAFRPPVYSPAPRMLSTPVFKNWDLRGQMRTAFPVRFRALAYRPANAAELRGLEGLGNFLKKAVKGIGRVLAKPIGLISKKLEKKVVDFQDKVADKVDDIHTKIQDTAKKALKSVGSFLKKNWKWVVVAAAVVATIYTMGGTAAILAKLTSAKAWLVAKATAIKGWTMSKVSTCLSAIKKLTAGKKMGELNQKEVEAVGDANEVTGQSLIPDKILECLGKKAMTLEEQKEAIQEDSAENVGIQKPLVSKTFEKSEEKKGLPSWVIPAAAAAGGLMLAMVMSK